MDASSDSVWTVKQLVDLHLATSGKRLLLPPIQRSIVWTNAQVIDYWDSLLRGYPAGMMMVHKPTGHETAQNLGRDSDGNTIALSEEDLMLFDGQQRITSVLLGLGKGQMTESRKLWVDLGSRPSRSSGLKFQLRMTSSGQPFGYRADAPNQKTELRKRQAKWDQWNGWKPERVFKDIKGPDLVDSTCAVPFATIWNEVLSGNVYGAITKFSLCDNADKTIVTDFVAALGQVSTAQVLLQNVPPAVVSDASEYIRFFGRVGRGGTQLSNDELTYSIIKSHYPRIHDRMAHIERNAGHLADEVDLVLGSLRVAKTLAPWATAREWDIIGRPSPLFVSGLRDLKEVEREFLDLVNEPMKLEGALEGVRNALSYQSVHTEGLPSILLGSLSRELVDVLILFAVRRGTEKPWDAGDRAILRAFVLHWLLFVGDSGKGAWLAFRHAGHGDWTFGRGQIRRLNEELERAGAARFVPRQDQLAALRRQIEGGDHVLRQWGERFTAADTGSERKPGDALRVLSTNPTLIRHALMWLQRHYIQQHFPDYDPTSERDDDLPIDLDHIVPQSHFGFDWRSREERLDSDAISDNFRWQRMVVGNSLGNYRWLSASDNRARGDGAFEPLPDDGDLVSDPRGWQELVDKRKWSKDDVATWQRLTDLRTIELYEHVLCESGIADILPEQVASEDR